METIHTDTPPRFETLESWRKHFSLTLKDASRIIGISHSHYKAIEIGRVSPSVNLAEQIIEKACVPLSALRGRRK